MSDETNSAPPEVTPEYDRFASEPTADAQVFGAWAEAQSTPEWLLAAARHKAAWPEGREVTEAEYLQALKDAQSEVIQ